MIIKYSPSFLATFKKADVRIRKSFKLRINLFAKSPYNQQLNNHALRDKWKGYRSIDINSDWRAIYEEIKSDEPIAYFVAIGTHEELYK